MAKTITSLILLPLLLFLEIGVGPLHNCLQSQEILPGASFSIGAVQTDPAPPNVCPVCRFVQFSFLLSLVLFSASLRRRCDSLPLGETTFPSPVESTVHTRGPPVAE